MNCPGLPTGSTAIKKPAASRTLGNRPQRPISERQIESTIATIENDVFSSFENEVESRRLGELVMEHLRELDDVAFVRFASVYKQFDDAHDFVETLRPMLSEVRPSR